jgi:hypothetical protein
MIRETINMMELFFNTTSSFICNPSINNPLVVGIEKEMQLCIISA